MDPRFRPWPCFSQMQNTGKHCRRRTTFLLSRQILNMHQAFTMGSSRRWSVSSKQLRCLIFKRSRRRGPISLPRTLHFSFVLLLVAVVVVIFRLCWYRTAKFKSEVCWSALLPIRRGAGTVSETKSHLTQQVQGRIMVAAYRQRKMHISFMGTKMRVTDHRDFCFARWVDARSMISNATVDCYK